MITKGGFDISIDFDLSMPSMDGIVISVNTDVSARLYSQTLLGDVRFSFSIYGNVDGGISVLSGVHSGETAIDEQEYSFGGMTPGAVSARLFLFNDYFAVTFNGVSVYTISFAEIEYAADYVTAGVESTHTISANVLRRELYDGREAIYGDYESNGASMISSVIQSRPVEIYPWTDDAIIATMSFVGDTITPKFIKGITISEKPSQILASDSIVYFENVLVFISRKVLEAYGFITRMLRLSELSTNIAVTTSVIQERAMSESKPISVQCRFDPSVTYCDVASVYMQIPGNSTVIQRKFFITDISVNISLGIFSQSLSGREVDL